MSTLGKQVESQQLLNCGPSCEADHDIIFNRLVHSVHLFYLDKGYIVNLSFL
jgi:hypothetical protein